MASIYQPLRNGKAEIRLLTLEPAPSVDNDVVCSLSVSSLHGRPRFEALSYCWGDSNLTKTILLNGTEWQVTVNLEIALRYLRHTTERKALWVDAVCINQQDVHERGNQVKLMKDIYSMASIVRVWLGEAADASDEVMRAVHAISNMDPAISDKSAFLQNISIDGHCLVNDLPSGIPCVDAFANRPWWTRAWVVQEVLLANSAVLHCGHEQLPMEDFLNFRMLADDLSKFGGRSLYRGVIQSIGSLGGALEIFKALRNLMTSTVPRASNPASTALQILAQGWGLKATDPRDKIYGMLGIIPDAVCQVQPRYDWSVEEVYTIYAVQLIKVSRSLSVFDFASSVRNPQLQIPSWVPDWSVRDPVAHQANQHILNGHWKACGSLSLSAHVVSNTTIRLRGIKIGTVTRTGDVFKMTPGVNDVGVFYQTEARQHRTYLQWLGLLGFDFLDDPNFAAAAGGTLRTAFCQTVSRCLTINKQTGKPSFCVVDDDFNFDLFLGWWEWLSNAKDQPLRRPGRLVETLQTFFSLQNQQSRFVMTHEGAIGTAPQNTVTDDVIYVLGGGNQPYVLRPTRDALQQPAFTLVGPCYLHGFMRGEATTRAAEPVECHDVYLR